MNTKAKLFYTESVIGARKLSNVCWAFILLLGTIGFLLTGIASYFGKGCLFFDEYCAQQGTVILFEPQGLVMCFYGMAGLFLSLYLWGALLWDVGSGYNEFDYQKGIICLFRWGFPGENRRIRIYCRIQDVKSIRIQTTTSLLSRYSVCIQLKNQQNLPLNQIEDSFSLKQIEQKAAQLAQSLQVPIEDA